MNLHLNNKPLTIFGDGSQKRAFSYIGDCVEPLWNAGFIDKSSTQIINLGGTKNISIDEAADLLIKVMGGGKKEYKEARHEVKNAWSTWKKSVEILGYNEQHNLEQGLTKMWDWAKNQPKRSQKIWESYELEKGIYNFWK